MRSLLSKGWIQSQLQTTARTSAIAKLDGPAYWAKVSPRLLYPHWLSPVSEVLDRAERALAKDGEPVRACVSVPPQHGKSTHVRHWLARLVARRPRLRHALCSYGAELAHPHSAEVRDQVADIGVALRRRAARYWSTEAGGGVIATGIPGPLTGHPIDGIAIIDDPFRDRAEAASPTIRNTKWAWHTGTLFTRTHEHTSIIYIATRWDIDDLTGRLTSGKHGRPYEAINLPAIDDDGNVLCPMLHSRAKLEEAREQDPWTFESLYQGRPTPIGARLFGDPFTVLQKDLPRGPHRTVIGLDFAYTDKTRADWSVAVVLQSWERDVYVTHVTRAQAKPEEWARTMMSLRDRYPGAVFAFIGSTTEIGQAKMISSFGGPAIRTTLAKGSKYTRALPVAAAWNHGASETGPSHYQGRNLHVVSDTSWFAALAGEAQGFTGADGHRDDQVDALGAAYAVIATSGAGTPLVTGNVMGSLIGRR